VVITITSDLVLALTPNGRSIPRIVTSALSFLTVAGIIPFSLSSVIIIIFTQIQFAKIVYLEISTVVGFVYLIAGVVLMVYVYRKIALPEDSPGILGFIVVIRVIIKLARYGMPF